LLWYQSRWYDPELGRFLQPDSIVPGAGEGGNPNSIGYLPNVNYSALVVNYSENQLLAQLNRENQLKLQNPNAILSLVPINPLAFDRYAYCFNNPINYNDPTGHFAFLAALAFIPVYGWIALGALAVGTVVYFAMGGPQALATALAPSLDSLSPASFSGKAGGAAEAAQHLSMLLGGVDVGGFGPHPGGPDPDGRDRKHNVEGLRNTLRDIQHNMRKGESINDFLTRQGWGEQQIQKFITQMTDYLDNVLSTDVEFYGVSQDLEQEVIDLASKIGIR
jgi:hypothetical protein